MRSQLFLFRYRNDTDPRLPEQERSQNVLSKYDFFCSLHLGFLNELQDKDFFIPGLAHEPG